MKSLICRVENCQKIRAKESTLCPAHKWRWSKYKSFELPIKPSLPAQVLRVCRKHGELKIKDVFKDGLDKNKNIKYRCKHCKKEDKKNYTSTHKDQIKERSKIYEKNRKKYDSSAESLSNLKNRLKKKYNITIEQYEQMIIDQNGCCWICGISENIRNYPSEKNKRTKLCIDHCHKTEIVRGLLCWRCNGMLGMASDSIATLSKAIEYLRLYEAS